jgi:hypothetical protein
VERKQTLHTTHMGPHLMYSLMHNNTHKPPIRVVLACQIDAARRTHGSIDVPNHLEGFPSRCPSDSRTFDQTRISSVGASKWQGFLFMVHFSCVRVVRPPVGLEGWWTWEWRRCMVVGRCLHEAGRSVPKRNRVVPLDLGWGAFLAFRLRVSELFLSFPLSHNCIGSWTLIHLYLGKHGGETSIAAGSPYGCGSDGMY